MRESMSVTKNILYRFDSSSGESIQPVFTINATQLLDDFYPDRVKGVVNGFLKNLRATEFTKNLQESPLPSFSLEDDSATKQLKALQVLWGSARIHLEVYFSLDGATWYQVGVVPVIHPMGYEFRQDELFDFFTQNIAFEMEQTAQIGLKLKNVGYGLLTSTDRVEVLGSVNLEVIARL